MRVYHNSRLKDHREPFGAVQTGTEIRLALEAEGENIENVRLLLWRDEAAVPQFVDMKQTAAGRYEITVNAPETGCLLWYAFSVEIEEDDSREVIYYGNNYEELGGEGCIWQTEPHRYQITVYKAAEVPSWYRDGIVYQIFPDRFARDDNWKERCLKDIESGRYGNGGERRFVQEDWNTPAFYVRDENGRVTDWPIYGGSFKGIESKLDYLRSLGVTAIYLNPVVEAVSNHRYDTADYMKPDPALGTEEEFKELAEAAAERGIHLILDGVFSHTGSDSKYFDRYGNYEGVSVGAYRHEDSPYRSWYRFDENEPCGYRSWWGVDDLPEVEENDPGFRELITGEQGVIAHWMELGASGWRLDVADELPDSFIEAVRKRVKSSGEDSLLIGEVWEDASNKISYGERRRYLLGDELDGTMNYPLRTILLDYINYTIGSEGACDMLMSLKENYPEESFYGALNLIGSHDRERIITAMAAEEDYPSAVNKVKVLSALQFALPGVPCIYYGDEAGLTGGVDPLNRNGFPWGYENLDLGYHYRMLGLIYDEHPVLKDGEFIPLSGREGINDDVFAFIRSYAGKAEEAEDSESILVLANRSYGPSDVDLSFIDEARCGYAIDLLTGDVFEPDESGSLGVIHMDRLSAMIICLQEKEPELEMSGRSAGVVCHISSLGEGALGKPAREFADYLALAGMKVWQVLPLNPAGLGGSPYSSYSAFAGDPNFIDRTELPDDSGLERFISENRGWLDEYTAYALVREVMDGEPWFKWPDEYKFGDPREILDKLEPEYGDRISELIHEQYWFSVQWDRLREYAGARGISIMGDLPMYMSADSADVWGNKEIFRLDENGGQKVHAGVPPDAFSGEGQDWGNPLYDWEKLREGGYSWWMRRIEQCARRYDILRIDHFRGLSEYYAIPEGGKPSEGMWQHSAGLRFVKAIRRMLKREGLELKLLAEDLGYLDAGVKDLIRLSGLPGMDIWQFTSDEMLSMSKEKAAKRAFYTGTHDNDTLVGYVRKAVLHDNSCDEGSGPEVNADTGYGAGEDAAQERRTEILKKAEEEALKIITEVYKSPSFLAMVQLQDMFMLDSDARMNVPGIAEGNWSWQIPGGSVTSAYSDAGERAEWFRDLAVMTGRY